jgi:chemotaxis protein MotA
MNINTIVGLCLGLLVMFVTAAMGGRGLGGFLDLHAFLIVIGGCTSAVIVAVDLQDLMTIPGIMRRLFGGSPNYKTIIDRLTKFSEIARRDGLLALESSLKDISDETFKKGLQMAIDGTSSEDIQKFFDTHMEVSEKDHEHGKKIIECYEKWSPSFGLLGTLQGLILMLQNLDDPSTIAPSMGVAMVATFYGAFAAFLFGGPLASKMQRAFDNEHHKHLIIRDGITSIQNGENPRLLEQRLSIYL